MNDPQGPKLVLHYDLPADLFSVTDEWCHSVATGLHEASRLPSLGLQLRFETKNVTQPYLYEWLQQGSSEHMISWNVSFPFAQLMGLGNETAIVSISAKDAWHRLSSYTLGHGEAALVHMTTYLLCNQDSATTQLIVDQILSLNRDRSAGHAPSTFKLQCDVWILAEMVFHLMEVAQEQKQMVDRLLASMDKEEDVDPEAKVQEQLD